MDSSQHTFSFLDELRYIQAEARRTDSLDDLRYYFERVKALRHAYADDFDALLDIGAVQHEIIDRARLLRGSRLAIAAPDEASGSELVLFDKKTRPAESEQIPSGVQRLDSKNWQRAVYIGVFIAIILFAAFFYLIQTARRLNQMLPEVGQRAAQPAPAARPEPANERAANALSPPHPLPVAVPLPTPPPGPALRLYTDLIPGTVSIDGKPPKSLKDGELILENLQLGLHTIRVAGHNADAEFSYHTFEKQAPRVDGVPMATNVMAVLVSSAGGKGRLITNAEDSRVSLDNRPAGEAGPEGLLMNDLGKEDHDLQVTEGKDRQRFVLTYAPGPTLTVYVKSDPNAGTIVIMAKQQGADIYLNGDLSRRKTEAGQTRLPLKVGQYTVRVHKAGFIDPPAATVDVKKAEETAVTFKLQPAPQIATLLVKGALPGTMIYLDNDFAGSVGADGNASLSNVKPGAHIIELRRDEALPKKFERTFKTGDVITLSGPGVTLDKVLVAASSTPPPPPPPTPAAAAPEQDFSMQMDGEQVRKGGGFVPYHVPKVAGHYTFEGQARKGGFLKHGKLEWYAGYQNDQNYVLFTLDGRHASVHEVQDGISKEIKRITFDTEPDTWVQIDMEVKPDLIEARAKLPTSNWYDLGSISSPGRDFTQDKVGLHIGEKDEIAVSNFRFSAR